MMPRIFGLFVPFAMKAHQTLQWNGPAPKSFSFKLEEHRLRINWKFWTGFRGSFPIIRKKTRDNNKRSSRASERGSDLNAG